MVHLLIANCINLTNLEELLPLPELGVLGSDPKLHSTVESLIDQEKAKQLLALMAGEWLEVLIREEEAVLVS